MKEKMYRKTNRKKRTLKLRNEKKGITASRKTKNTWNKLQQIQNQTINLQNVRINPTLKGQRYRIHFSFINFDTGVAGYEMYLETQKIEMRGNLPTLLLKVVYFLLTRGDFFTKLGSYVARYINLIGKLSSTGLDYINFLFLELLVTYVQFSYFYNFKFVIFPIWAVVLCSDGRFIK